MTPEAATLTLAAFLSARLDEDEAAASNPSRAHFVSTAGGFEEHDCVDLEETYLVADPARVLADVAARRAILALHGEYGDACNSAAVSWRDHGPWPCDTLKLLAAPFASHPDYDGRWAVS